MQAEKETEEFTSLRCLDENFHRIEVSLFGKANDQFSRVVCAGDTFLFSGAMTRIPKSYSTGSVLVDLIMDRKGKIEKVPKDAAIVGEMSLGCVGAIVQGRTSGVVDAVGVATTDVNVEDVTVSGKTVTRYEVNLAFRSDDFENGQLLVGGWEASGKILMDSLVKAGSVIRLKGLAVMASGNGFVGKLLPLTSLHAVKDPTLREWSFIFGSGIFDVLICGTWYRIKICFVQ